jgi:hypothetical protein
MMKFVFGKNSPERQAEPQLQEKQDLPREKQKEEDEIPMET